MDPTKRLPPARFSPIESSSTTDQLMRLPLDYNIPPHQPGFDIHPGYISPDHSSHSDSESDSHSSFGSEFQSDSASDADSDSDIEIIISKPKLNATPFQIPVEPQDKKPLLQTSQFSPGKSRSHGLKHSGTSLIHGISLAESSEHPLAESSELPLNPFLFQEPQAVGHPGKHCIMFSFNFI
jgi:hypothetical protein